VEKASAAPPQTEPRAGPLNTVSFQIPEDYVQRVVKAMDAGMVLPVEINDRNAKVIGAGKLIGVENQIDAATGTLKCRAEVTPMGDVRLYPNLFVTVKVLLETKRNVILASTKALRRSPSTGEFSTWVIGNDGTPSDRRVVVGATQGDLAEICSGLGPGELVSLNPKQEFKHDQKVRYVKQPGPAHEKYPAAALAEAPQLRFLAWQDLFKKDKSNVRHPDGTPVTDAVEKELMNHTLDHTEYGYGKTKGGGTPLALHLLFSHPLFDGASEVDDLKFTTESGEKLPKEPPDGWGAGRGGDDYGLFAATATPGVESSFPPIINVRLRYLIGPLEDIKTVEVKPNYHVGLDLAGGSSFGGYGQTLEGRASVTIAVNFAGLGDRRFGAVAIAKDGREYPQVGSNVSKGGKGADYATLEFKVPLSEVAKFRIGTRPIRTQEWKHVVLPPRDALTGAKDTVPSPQEKQTQAEPLVPQSVVDTAHENLKRARTEFEAGVASMINVAEAEQQLHWAEAMRAGDPKAAAVAKRDGAKHRLELMHKLYEAGRIAASEMVPVQREVAEAEVEISSAGTKPSAQGGSGATDAKIPNIPPRQVVADFLRLIKVPREKGANLDEIWNLTTRSSSASWSPSFTDLIEYGHIRPAHQLGNAEKALVFSDPFKDNSGRERVFYAILLNRDGKWLINENEYPAAEAVHGMVQGFLLNPGVVFDVQANELTGTWHFPCASTLTFNSDGTGVRVFEGPDGVPDKPGRFRWQVSGSTLRLHFKDHDEVGTIRWMMNHEFRVLDKEGKTEGYSDRDPRQSVALGSVIERVAYTQSEAGPAYFIGIDSDQARISDESLKKKLEVADPHQVDPSLIGWTKKHRLDAVGRIIMADGKPAQFGLRTFEMLVFPAPEGAWEKATAGQVADEVRKRLQEWGFISVVNDVLTEGKTPATWFFQTREGSQGVLQITGLEEKPRGVKVRYKILHMPDSEFPAAAEQASEPSAHESAALATLHAELAALLQSHKEEHPEVQALRERILQQEETERALAKGESEDLAKLHGEEAALLQKYREEHPTVQAVRAKIEIQTAVDKIAQTTVNKIAEDARPPAPSDPLREADQRVLQQQYEKTLADLLEAKKDAALAPSQNEGTPEAQTKRSDVLKSKIQLLEESRAELRKQLEEQRDALRKLIQEPATKQP